MAVAAKLRATSRAVACDNFAHHGRQRTPWLQGCVRRSSQSANWEHRFSENDLGRLMSPVFWRHEHTSDPQASALVQALLPKVAQESLRTTAVGLEVVESSHTAFVDRLVMDAVGRRIRQIVSFGAGFDCRPYRLDVPPQLKIVEVDEDHVHEAKETILPASGARARCQVVQVPLSWAVLEKGGAEAVPAALQAAVDARKPCLFVVERIVARWQSASIAPFFSALGEKACNGSRLVVQVSAIGLETPVNVPEATESLKAALKESGWARVDVVGSQAMARVFPGAPAPQDDVAVLVIAERGSTPVGPTPRDLHIEIRK